MKMNEQGAELLNRAYEWWSRNNPHTEECMDVRKYIRLALRRIQPDSKAPIDANTMNAVYRVLTDFAAAFPDESVGVELSLKAWEELFLGV